MPALEGAGHAHLHLLWPRLVALVDDRSDAHSPRRPGPPATPAVPPPCQSSESPDRRRSAPRQPRRNQTAAGFAVAR
ncbi:hypothetical protein AL036_11610 [Salipiger aestuarii]|nr:hypothetical protein AL036_11610 [Salipiger aestuarii]KAB2541713.1 hypothetical protein AL035_11090 [Salipiger aestuarii]